jgi:hypothetical protein
MINSSLHIGFCFVFNDTERRLRVTRDNSKSYLELRVTITCPILEILPRSRGVDTINTKTPFARLTTRASSTVWASSAGWTATGNLYIETTAHHIGTIEFLTSIVGIAVFAELHECESTLDNNITDRTATLEHALKIALLSTVWHITNVHTVASRRSTVAITIATTSISTTSTTTAVSTVAVTVTITVTAISTVTIAITVTAISTVAVAVAITSRITIISAIASRVAVTISITSRVASRITIVVASGVASGVAITVTVSTVRVTVVGRHSWQEEEEEEEERKIERIAREEMKQNKKTKKGCERKRETQVQKLDLLLIPTAGKRDEKQQERRRKIGGRGPKHNGGGGGEMIIDTNTAKERG